MCIVYHVLQHNTLQASRVDNYLGLTDILIEISCICTHEMNKQVYSKKFHFKKIFTSY